MIKEEGKYGYILEADIHIPERLHSYHDPLPPVLTRRKVEFQELSGYQKEFWSNIENTVKSKFILKLYISEGTIVSRIHNVLRFST
jgi:hypothetical protein